MLIASVLDFGGVCASFGWVLNEARDRSYDSYLPFLVVFSAVIASPFA